AEGRLGGGRAKDPGADLDDQLALLRLREEHRGQQLADLRLVVPAWMPTHERLAPHRTAPGERQYRLVVELQLEPGQGVAQPALELQVRAHRPAHARLDQ